MLAFCSTMKIVVPWRLIAWMMSKTCSTKTGERPIEGSSMHSSRGRAIRARPIATICCSPPDSVPAELLEPLLDPREEGEDALHVRFDLARIGSREGAHLQVLEHGHAREQAPRLGHRRDAALDALGGRQRR